MFWLLQRKMERWGRGHNGTILNKYYRHAATIIKGALCKKILSTAERKTPFTVFVKMFEFLL
jgi:hypothetical protein